METPCQKIVWDLVPAIRASLAIELVNKGQSQAASAKLLGIAPSAVSQYISGKRGYRIEFQGETKELIEKLSQDLIDNKVEDIIQGSVRFAQVQEEMRATAIVLVVLKSKASTKEPEIQMPVKIFFNGSEIVFRLILRLLSEELLIAIYPGEYKINLVHRCEQLYKLSYVILLAL